MGILDRFRRRYASSKRRPADRPADKESRPKNARLIVALVGAFALMVLLAGVNFRLLRSPSVAGKGPAPSAPSRAEFNQAARANSASTVSNSPSCTDSPEVTFYSKLSSQEEQDSELDDEAAGPFKKTVPKNGASKKSLDSWDSKSDPQQEATNPSDRKAGDKRREELGPHKAGLVKHEAGSKTYTVQVGAFTQPQIAQHRAMKWKSRGYDVVLKPMAEPKTGVIYRLYLGNFTSEKEADDLVKRLKIKEGISAFKLLVRN